jgi:hypothetical protein
MAQAPVDGGAHLDIVFTPERSEWNGSSSIQLRITDLRPRA